MLRRDLASGLEDYEWRRKTGKNSLPQVNKPYWDGAFAPGDRILFFGEQGFGDAIQFARYIPMIAKRCARVIVPCKPAVKRLIASVTAFADNVDVRDEMFGRKEFEQYIPAMSAMRIFGTDMSTIPGDVPHLKAAPADVEKFRRIIRGGAKPGAWKIGIAWTGSPTNTISWKKTVNPTLFERLMNEPAVELYSLQKMRDDMPYAVKRVPAGVNDLATHLNDFADTSAAIDCLDLVITVDTAVAHLAGALAKPVWR
ncbi:MAG: hypothetical protein VW268_01770 [Rhodospirillaceae bacterium]